MDWYLEDSLLQSGSQTIWCATASGVYTLILTDMSTGCQNTFEKDFRLNENFDCLTATDEIQESTLTIYPNPFSEELHLDWNNIPLNAQMGIRVWNASGILVLEKESAAALNTRLSTSTWPNGMYTLQMSIGPEIIIRKILKQ